MSKHTPSVAALRDSYLRMWDAGHTQGIKAVAGGEFDRAIVEVRAKELEVAADEAPNEDVQDWLYTRAASVRAEHHCEQWMLQSHADFGRYCGACGKREQCGDLCRLPKGHADAHHLPANENREKS